MEQLINNLIGRYEKGGMSRRELVGALAVLAVGTQSASAAAFESSTINHVSIVVGDLKRSVDWYQRTFGLSLMRQDTNLVQLSVGKTQHLSLRQGAQKGFDHFAIGIDRFNHDAVVADLKSRGATAQDGNGAGLHVADPDGSLVQVIANGAA
jgi:catechol 2,3-dioxygenase-like lactoylglutathione lyase family enzyme